MNGIFTPELLDRCIACGFCLPACPTYGLSGVESSSPRGRISLMRAIETGVLPDDDPTVVEESSFCLGCRACEPVCPAGVRYGELLEEWRDHTWHGRRRSWRLRGLLWAVDSRSRVRALGLVRRHARAAHTHGGSHLMLGCFERLLYPGVSRSAQQLAPELAVTAAQGCCGALHAHNGELHRGRELARELGEQLPGAIVTTAGGCAAHLAGVLGRDRVFELSEWLARVEQPPAEPGSPGSRRSKPQRGSPGPDQPESTPGTPGPLGPRIGLQDSCHLRHGLGVWQEPRNLLARIGEYVELPSAAACCGAAGTYAILQPDASAQILERHLDEITAADLDVIAVVNPGCQRQLKQGIRRRRLRTRVMHIAELLANPPT